MSETQSLVKTEDKSVEFVPYGAQDKVKLSVAMIKNLVAVKTKSGKTCSDTDAIKFLAMCQARRLNPYEGDAFLIGYDGKDGPSFSLITAHQAFLKRAELNPEYDGMKSGIIVEDDGKIQDLEGDFFLEGQKVLGGWATVYFKNRKQPMHKRVRLKRFQKAWGIWQDDPAGMICKCAEADALRSSFPTMLGGLYLREEIVAEPVKTSKPIFSTPVADNRVTVQPAAKSEPEPEPAKEAMSEPVTEQPAFNVLKAVKGLIKHFKLTEEKILAYMVDLGAVEPGVKLDELSTETLQTLHDQFSDIVEKIKEAEKPDAPVDEE